MEEIIKSNVIALYAKINESRLNDKYCDVTIKVEEKSFRCHRHILGSASEYFDAMFSGTLKESTSEDIELKDIEVDTFEDVIQFIYTGKVVPTKSNVLALMRASDFYNLPGLEKLCRQFIKENLERYEVIEDALEMFIYSYRTRLNAKEDEFVISLGAYVRRYLHYFLNTASFLVLGFDELKLILQQPTRSEYDNVAAYAIARWVQQSIHFKGVKNVALLMSLFESVHFENVSLDCMGFIVKQFLTEYMILKQNENDGRTKKKDDKSDNGESSADNGESSANNDASSANNDASSANNDADGKTCAPDASLPQSLYVYVNTSPATATFVYTLQKYNGGFKWAFLCDAIEDLNQACSVRSLDDRIYCLKYYVSQPSSPQTFSVSSSVSMFTKSNLKVPPLVVSHFDLCGMNNSLYLYNKNTFSTVVRSAEDAEFDDEMLSRGVYAYNCEIDKWTALPPLKQKLYDACMTCDYNRGLVYLIGGRTPAMRREASSTVQVYDARTGAWMACPSTEDSYKHGFCCFDDKRWNIIVSGGRKRPQYAEHYDPVAGKWSRFQTAMNTDRLYKRHLIPYKGDVWALTGNLTEVLRDGSWSNDAPQLREALENNELINDADYFIVHDCITFKTCGL